MSDSPRCDMCEHAPGELHPDIALRCCSWCASLFTDYRRATTLGQAPEYATGRKTPGPLPTLTPFRLGLLTSLFGSPRARRKLERIAEAM